MFIQILFLPEWVLKVLKNKGAIICYDFDDAVYTYSRPDFDSMIKYADKVIIASPFLKESFDAERKDYAVIYSPVDTDKIVPCGEENAVFTIGWIGSPWTAPYLQELKETLQLLAKQISFKLLVVGADIKIDDVIVDSINWSMDNELEALRKMDVGIMPLPDTEWAKMKGGYKLYLYLAAGKPVIASPSGINISIVNQGVNGYVALSNEEWINAFLNLRNNAELRKKLGLNARADAEHHYSYHVCSQQLSEFLNKELTST